MAENGVEILLHTYNGHTVCASVNVHMQTIRWRHLNTGTIACRKSHSELASVALGSSMN